MSTILTTQEPEQIEIRGCLSKHKKSQYFQAILIYKDSAGEEVRKSRSTKKARETEAYHVMMQMIEEEKKAIYTASPGTVFVDFLQYWLNEIIIKTVEETTYNGYVLNMDNHIIPYFKPLKLRLKDVRPIHIQRFLDYKLDNGACDGGPLKATSVSKFYANLKTSLDYAVSHELALTNPARMISGPKTKKYDASYYTIEQIGLLWKACKGSVIEAAVFLTSIYGFRRGEVCGLKWEHVSFQKKHIRIIETRTRGKGEVLKGTKNNASRRTMPLMGAVDVYLQRLQKQQEEHAAFCGNTWVDSGYIVVDEMGKPITFGRLQKNYKRILANNGLPDIRFHDLRHSVATYLLEIGIPIEEVSAWLGHSSIATTAKVYAHVNIGTRRNAANKLDKLMGYENVVEEQPIGIEDALKTLFSTDPETA